jgi:hypothetical protein
MRLKVLAAIAAALLLVGCSDTEVVQVPIPTDFCAGVVATVTPSRAQGYWLVQVLGTPPTTSCSVTRLSGSTIVEQSGFLVATGVMIRANEGDLVMGWCGSCQWGPYVVPPA